MNWDRIGTASWEVVRSLMPRNVMVQSVIGVGYDVFCWNDGCDQPLHSDVSLICGLSLLVSEMAMGPETEWECKTDSSRAL